MIGKTISHFRVLEEVGRGGMGVVYRAHDRKLDRFVALKFLPRHLPGDTGDGPSISFAERKRRFMDEAKAASSLDHANICTIYDINETDDGQLFIAMAWYEGETLKTKIGRGPMPIEDVVNYGKQIVAGLAAAHARGLVHRDIKPANVMVTEDGIVKILDFGLSKFSAEGPSDLSADSRLIGTAAYMSPEQVHEASVDHQSDLWATGVVLYEMATARKPFRGANDLSVLYAVVNHEPEFSAEAFRAVPLALRGIIETALAKTPRDRFESAEALHVALEHLHSDSSSVTLAVSSVRWMWRRQRWRRRALGGAAVFVALATTLGLAWHGRGGDTSVVLNQTATDPTAIVSLGFQNQASEADAWVCVALAELAKFVVPGDGATLHWLAPTDADVASLQDESGFDETTGLAPAVRSAVFERTSGARALTGRCRVLGDTDQVEVDVRVEDLVHGGTQGRSLHSGDQGELIDVAVSAMAPLVPVLGGSLRTVDPDWAMPALANDSKPLLEAARAALRRLDAPAAQEHIDAALRIQPFHPELLSMEADSLLRMGRIRDARTAADRALRAVRNAPLALQADHYARVLELAGAPVRAAALYRVLWPESGPGGDDPAEWIDRGFELAGLLATERQDKVVERVLDRLRVAGADPRRIALIEADAARRGARNRAQLDAARRGRVDETRDEAPLLWARARHLESEPLRRLGQPDQAREALREARAVFVAHESALGEADTWIVEGVILWDQQDLSGAKTCYERAARLYQSLGDNSRYGRNLQNLALIEGHLGDVAVAAGLFRSALALYSESSDRIAEVTTSFNLAELVTHDGKLDEAVEAYQRALRLEPLIVNQDTRAALYSSYGEFLFLRGDSVEAEAWLEKALTILESAEDRLPFAAVERRLARLYLFRGEPVAARDAADRAIEQFTETDVGAFRARALHRSADIQMATGDFDAAESSLSAAMVILDTAVDTRSAGEVGVTRASLRLAQGDAPGALEVARRAVETLRSSGSVLELARAHGVVAAILLASAQLELAQEEIDTATGLLRGIDELPVYSIPVALVEARLMLARGDAETAGRRMRDLLIRCKKLGAGHLELHVELALARLEISSGNPAAGRSRLQRVERDAERKGLGWVLREAQASSTS